MLLHDGSKLTTEQIETLNAHGPYTMAVWQSGDVFVGNEEGLAGRSAYFVKKIRESILKNFSVEALKEMSILDIGCNDGWVLHQLSDLPFKKMVGIEPREKNIEKGCVVRGILKLENNVEYRVGDIESLQGEVYDIVLCCGVLYHVESIPTALRNIRNVCSKMVFLESRCLSSHYITEELKSEIEMRDLVYQFKDEICGVTAQKYESAYHDSSAAHTTIVNVPSTESLVMNLHILGFENIDVVAAPDIYRAAVWKDKRPLGGVCIAATLSDAPVTLDAEEDAWISEYEKSLAAEVLPRTLLEPLYRIFCKNEEVALDEKLEKVRGYVVSTEADGIRVDAAWLPEGSQGKYTLEIVKNFRYRPNHKIALEYGKLLKSEGKLDEAIDVLKSITTELNADWRAVYRANHLLSLIYKLQGDAELADKYLRLTLQGNPKFPVAR